MNGNPGALAPHQSYLLTGKVALVTGSGTYLEQQALSWASLVGVSTITLDVPESPFQNPPRSQTLYEFRLTRENRSWYGT